MVTLMNTDEHARQLLSSIDAGGDIDEAYTQAFVALTHAAEIMAQEKEDAEKGDDAETGRLSRVGIIRQLVDDFGPGYIIKCVKETDDYTSYSE